MTIIVVMARRYELMYAESALKQLAVIERRHHSLIRRAIEQHQRYEPNVRALNRKPLVKPSRFGEAWELRCGPENRFRIFYRVEEDLARVRILAMGLKIRAKLYIGGEEFTP